MNNDPFYLFIAANKQRKEKHNRLFRAFMGESYAPFANEKAKAEFEAYNEELRIQFEQIELKNGKQLKAV